MVVGLDGWWWGSKEVEAGMVGVPESQRGFIRNLQTMKWVWGAFVGMGTRIWLVSQERR